MWCYPPGGKGPKFGFHRKHDLIYYYGSNHKLGVFHRPYRKLTDYAKSKFTKTDDDGRAYKEYPGGRSYLDEARGSPIPDWWTDIHSLGQTISNERLGYPTQKPLALLERIIRASSNPGDIVLDPFCGCGTTVEAAATMNRQFIGIDIASFALDLIRERRLESRAVPIIGVPLELEDAAQMVKEDAFSFEKWAIERIPGLLANQVQVGDGGIDGRGRVAFPLEGTAANLLLAQVKGGEFKPNDLRAFRGVMASEDAALGVFITLHQVTGRRRRNAERELAGFGSFQQGASEFPRLQLWSIEEYYDDRFPYLPTLAHPITGKALEGPLL